jgi:hypothetical protein
MLDGLDISLDITAAGTVDETIVPVSIMDVTATASCDCETCNTTFEDINAAQPQIPDVVFTRPTFRIMTVIPPLGSVSSPLAFTSEFIQNNAGLHTAVRAYLNGGLVNTDILLNNSFATILHDAFYTLTVEVDYLQGPDIADSTGKIIHNPIIAGTLSDSMRFKVTGAVFSGSVATLANLPTTLDFSMPKDWPALLDTGTSDLCFWIAYDPNRTILSAKDRDTAYIELKSLFNSQGRIMLNGRNYFLKAMVNAIPYVNNHVFEFTPGFD